MGADREKFAHRQHVFGEFALRSDDLLEDLDEGCRIFAGVLGAALAKILEIEAGRKSALLRAGIGQRPRVVPSSHLAGGTS